MQDNPRKNILIVDDDKVFLFTLAEFLRANTFTVTGETSSLKALSLAQEKPFDLIIVDINMPQMDGIEFIARMHKLKRKQKFAVITGFPSITSQKELLKLGVHYIFIKPFNFSYFLRIVQEILRNGTQAKSTIGRIEDIDLFTALQIFSYEKRTALIKVNSEDGREGSIYIKNGRLLSCLFAGKKGAAAIQDIMALEDYIFSVEKNIRQIPEFNINKSIEHILLETSKALDDRKREQEKQSITHKNNLKEDHMNVKKLREAIEVLKEDLGDGLLATDIYTVADGQSIAGYNTQPKASALFNRVTQNLVSSLKSAGFPGLGKYYILDLVDEKLVMILPMADFQWGMLLDKTKTQLGLLLNIILPKALDAFEEALTS